MTHSAVPLGRSADEPLDEASARRLLAAADDIAGPDGGN
jgi:hypothetical protein